MIARHEGSDATADVWAKIAAPLPKGVISWRQDGRPVTRDGKFFARFVSYIDAQFVRERLDSIVPGEWNLSLEMLPHMTTADADGVDNSGVAFKARLSVLGVSRECVGQGKDYKQAATDAFKRAAVRFGIGHELYDMDMLWVQMDGDGKYAKPVEDPQAAYDRKHGRKSEGEQSRPPRQNGADADSRPTGTTEGRPQSTTTHGDSPESNTERGTTSESKVPPCPKCGGRMYDNRAENAVRVAAGKKSRPDFKCADRACGEVIWPAPQRKASRKAAESEPANDVPPWDYEPPDEPEIPF